MKKGKDFDWNLYFRETRINIIFLVLGLSLGNYLLEENSLKYVLTFIIVLSASDFIFSFIKVKLTLKNKWKISWFAEAIIGIVFIVIALFISYSFALNSDDSFATQNKLEGILQDYQKTHTYSKPDFFVCADTSIDIWNIVKTEGINAQICVGNVDETFSYETYKEFLNKINHAWVIAESEPFKWIALETTGGYLVWGENSKNDLTKEINGLYYEGNCFDNPKEFKEFISLRDNYFNVCNQHNLMLEDWRENYVGTLETDEALKYQGQIEQKGKECQSIVNQLDGILV